MVEYSYENAAFNMNIFQRELSVKSYAENFVEMKSAGDDITLVFDEALSGADEDDLNALMASHPSLKWQLTFHLDNYRWQKEIGGISSGGYGIDTTDRSKALINGAYSKVLAAGTPTAIMAFKTMEGWQDLEHSEVEAIALDVADHVEKCFTAEKTIMAKIWAGTLTTTAEVEEDFDDEYDAL